MRAPLRSVLPLVALAFGAAPPAAHAQGISGLAQPVLSDITLENITSPTAKGGSVSIARIEISKTNLTKDELTGLFSGAAPKDTVAALIAKMKAAKVSMPEAVIKDKDVTVNFHGFAITDIDAGKVGAVELAGLDGGGKSDDGEAKFKSSKITLKKLNLQGLVASLYAGKLTPDANLQVGSMDWRGFEAAFPDKDTPADAAGGNMVKVSLGSAVSETFYDGVVPVKGSGKVEHIVVELPRASGGAQQMAAFGVDKVDVSLTGATSYDKAKKIMTLEDLAIETANVGLIGLKGSFGGVDPKIFNTSGDPQAMLGALMGMDISNIALTYVDRGIAPKAEAYFAADQKKSIEDFKTEYAGMAVGILPMMLGGDASARALANAIGKFIQSPGTLSVTAKAKGAPLKVVDLMKIKEPKALLSKIDISAIAGN